ncbi:hypothetical protein OJF2_32560 [Aquisphaera giovannonii]|uniref:Putative restriction endonuclease domain-containing protein n=1 Tax=Aquisphaera giovannonii TaxID=406548 RepID=A0A5B9W399_9BACT|nr:Uma2 family endonuclease [Aquisphaera giovannonii]QEH34714.1 hypothetical protein OJF2_32560 [Aquisphaera giovannonii]
MSTFTPRTPHPGIVYPDSDGQPMAENTLQFQWIVTIKENLDAAFRDRPDVFVAGDLFWYPVEGDNKTRTAPDAMVAIGRPKGYRGSYMQWLEGDVPPQVVFEVLSPGNSGPEMVRKRGFYERFGVREYYVYDPDDDTLEGWIRHGDTLEKIPDMAGWVSPLLGIRFDTSTTPLTIYKPDGSRFRTFDEIDRDNQALARDNQALARERDAAVRQAAESQERARQLEARLRELGLEP